VKRDQLATQDNTGEQRSSHFVIRYPPRATSQKHIEHIVTQLEAAWGGLAELLGTLALPHDLVTVTLEGADTTSYPRNDSGETMPVGPVPAIVLPLGASVEIVRRALASLLLSAAAGERAAHIPVLLEGMLGYLAVQQRELDLEKTQVALAKRRRMVTLDDLFSGPAQRDQQHYRLAATSFTAQLIASYGLERYRQFAHELNNVRPEVALETVYGKPLSTLEDEWQATIRAARQPEPGLGWVLWRAIGYWRPYWLTAVVIGLTVMAQDNFKTIFADGLQKIINATSAEHFDENEFTVLLAAIAVQLIVWFIINALASPLQDFLGARVGAKILNDLRRKLFTHMQRLSIGYYAHAQTGDIVARFTSDLSDIDKLVTSRIADGFYSIINIIWFTTAIALSQWRLALVILLALPLLMVGTRLFAAPASRETYRLKRAQAALASTVQENVKAQPVIKVFGLQSTALARLQQHLAQLYSNAVRANFLSQTVGTASTQGVLLVNVVFVLVGAVLVVQGQLNGGALAYNYILFGFLLGEAYNLTKKVAPSLIGASGALRRVDELLNAPVDVRDAPDAVALPRLASAVRFEDVSFQYGHDLTILDHVSVAIPKGQYIAFVGPSGSGKTTILNLLMRFYDPSAGAVVLDSMDLRQGTQASLHAQMAAVFQDTFLFNTTIRENIRFGKLNATDAEIEAAARAAEIHDLIVGLPKGYDTETGEMGSLLSGGQRQRVAIARAIVRDPAILVLDEPTSALDPATETAISQTLERLARNRTVVSTSHRLATVQHANRINVLRDGKLAEYGTHEQLLARKGLYYELWQKQHGVEVSPDGQAATLDMSRLRALPLFTVPLFANLEADALAELARRFHSTHFDAGVTLATEGQPCDTFFILARGRVAVTTSAASGRERTVATLEDGDYFGETALFEDALAPATTRTLQPSLVLALRRSDFLEALATTPALRESLALAIERHRLQSLIGANAEDQQTERRFSLRP
jgi:ATP-binding cassette subfamily B protein